MIILSLQFINEAVYALCQQKFILKFQQSKNMIKGQIPTIPKKWSCKTVVLKDNPKLKEEIKTYFIKTYEVYEKLFQLLEDERAYYIRAQPLRHPLIFYYGHTAAVYINKLMDYGLITSRINSRLENAFAVGVDEMDWDDLNQSHYEWPTLAEAREYRKKAKDVILDVIERSQEKSMPNWLCGLWVVMLGIEHERIHVETSAVIIRMVPLQYIKHVEDLIQCQYKEHCPQKVPDNSLVHVSPWKSTWNRNLKNLETFGWDNQFGSKQFDVAGFQASKMLVSNAEYRKFVEEGGYTNLNWWSDQGQRWIISKKRTMPIFWYEDGESYKLRTISKLIDMPWDWPAQVNNLQARAFCKWKSAKLGTYIRLPTEDEYYSIRSLLNQDVTEWEYQSVGNINMEYWMSPNPVNMFSHDNFYDIIGNVWQHTITPIYPFKNFEIHPVYQDFSTPTFDERHDLIKGGSFISTGNEALYHSRYAFRRHFYQFAGFRYISTPTQLEIDLHADEIISDSNVQMSLKHHYLNDKSYIVEFAQQIKKTAKDSTNKSKILTVGCSVGRAPIQFSKCFQQSIGIDYTTRYFQMSTRLKQKKFLKHKDIDINLETLDLNPDSIKLFEMNPENLDQRKINNCDWIVIDGYSLKKNTLGNVLKKVGLLAKSSFNIAILNVSDFNSLEKEQEKKILTSSVNREVIIGQEKILAASFEDQSYLPNHQRQIQFRLNFYSIIES